MCSPFLRKKRDCDSYGSLLAGFARNVKFKVHRTEILRLEVWTLPLCCVLEIEPRRPKEVQRVVQVDRIVVKPKVHAVRNELPVSSAQETRQSCELFTCRYGAFLDCVVLKPITLAQHDDCSGVILEVLFVLRRRFLLDRCRNGCLQPLPNQVKIDEGVGKIGVFAITRVHLNAPSNRKRSGYESHAEFADTPFAIRAAVCGHCRQALAIYSVRSLPCRIRRQ